MLGGGHSHSIGAHEPVSSGVACMVLMGLLRCQEPAHRQHAARWPTPFRSFGLCLRHHWTLQPLVFAEGAAALMQHTDMLPKP